MNNNNNKVKHSLEIKSLLYHETKNINIAKHK